MIFFEIIKYLKMVATTKCCHGEAMMDYLLC